jgi:glycerol-3-phosphate dehydrogenase
MQRSEILASLRTASPTVLIVGGGINGVGTFRDLALNGVDVLLIDRGDFCSGASSASSHMAHGGIRYLENGEFRLVGEAVRERNRLIENAPHLVRPLPTVIPIFRAWSGLLNAPLKFLGLLDRPAERGAVVIKIGLMLYDAYAKSQGTVPTHKFDRRAKALARYPRLNPAIYYAATYYDGKISSPERLTVELILDAEAEGPHARALNYVSLLRAEGDRVILRDEDADSTFEIRPRLIINAAGPWIDRTNAALGVDSRYIGGTKGSHVVLDHPELRAAIGKNEYFFENGDGRIVLILPFSDKVIVGTSDIPVEDPDSARCSDDEVNYFLGLAARVFPDIPVVRDQIVFRFSGVRPLERTGAKTTGQITRDHSIREDQLGHIPVYSLVGGKWTTFRAFAEQVTDKALAFLGLPRKADTRALPIGGGRDFPWTGYAQLQFYNQVERETGLGGREPERLFKKYGTRARDFAAYVIQARDEPLTTIPGWSRREVEFLARAEKIVHLDDLFLRRSRLAWLGELSRPRVDEFADMLGDSLGWTDAQKQAETARALAILSDRHGATIQ